MCCVGSPWVLAQRAPSEDPPELLPSDELVEFQPGLGLFSDSPVTEWVWHKTEDGAHPDGNEQAMVWLMNRARANPTREGQFLAASGDRRVASAIDYFRVDLAKMQAEFAAIPARQPAAFDRRIYEGSLVHSLDLIARDAQDHNSQFDRVRDAGFRLNGGNASVFSYAQNPVYAHAGFNIDWGADNGAGDGMQPGRGHRVGLMNSGTTPLTNVGIAMVPETSNATKVGPLVVSIVYARASTSSANHFNKFIVGTVWTDANGNDRYDAGEGLAGVRVAPDAGTYFAVTGDAGGYAIPVSADRAYVVTFSGGELASPQQRSVTVAGQSALVAWNAADDFETSQPETVVPELSIRRTEDGLLVSWRERAGEPHQLETTTDFSAWSLESGAILSDGSQRSVVVPLVESLPSRYFRLVPVDGVSN